MAKKKFLSLALALLMMLALLTETVWADYDAAFYEVTGGSITLVVLQDGAYVWSCDQSVTAADIPSEVVQQQEEGGTIVVPVVGINDLAFEGCAHLTSVSIPDSILTIGGKSFRGCPNLREITIAADNPFYVFSDGVLYSKDKTELILPLDYKAVGSYAVPDGITTIGEGAFYGCDDLTDISIPASVTSIGTYAFVNCISLSDVYYGGTEAQWKALFTPVSEYNEDLVSAMIHYNAAPAEPATPIETTSVSAAPTASTVLVNGEQVAFDAYNIGGNNYFKLRDLAYVLSGTEKQFEVSWDGSANAISLTSGQPYTAVGSEMAARGSGNQTAARSTSKILVDGEEVSLTAYNIGGNNYFKLRDLGQVFDFGVGWNNDTKTITIDTSTGYTE